MFKEKLIINSELTLARNSADQFYRILRKRCDYTNANVVTYDDRKDYKGRTITSELFLDDCELLIKDTQLRLMPKSDINKTNITDAPGFGSVRLVPPHEEANFDKDFFDFINNLVTDDTYFVDYGSGIPYFLYFIRDCKNKVLVEKNGFDPKIAQLKYIDAGSFTFSEKVNIITCFHCLEHLDEPEETIKKLIKSSEIFIFATPQKELIETSIYHYIYMDVDIFKKIFIQMKKPAFLHISKTGIDIIGIVVNSVAMWNKIKNNQFFVKHFNLYTKF